MRKDLIPRKDAEFNVFQINVLAAMTANAVAWGISPATILLLTTLQTAWRLAYLAYTDPAQRTRGVTEAKNAARLNYVQAFRPAIQQYIQENGVVTDQDRLDMGITPRDKNRTPVPAPTTVPQIDLKQGNGSQVRIHFKQGVDESGVSRRGKPAGVSRIVIVFKVVGPEEPVPVSAEDCPNRVDTGSSPYKKTFETTDAGKRLYVFGKWVNTTNQGDVWTTTAVSIIIPG